MRALFTLVQAAMARAEALGCELAVRQKLMCAPWVMRTVL